MHLLFERRSGRTVLAQQYAEPPLRIGSTFAIDDAASLILVCAGPGIFAGDTLEQCVDVGGGARVLLTSQSALQVHPSDADAPASVTHAYRVESGGELHCVWDPLIPFGGARVEQRFEIDVASGARLFWSDALMCGRAGRGERWQFDRVGHELRIRVGDALAYLERYRISPVDRGVQRPWVMAHHDYAANAVVCHPAVTPEIAELLQRLLDGMEVSVGVDLVSDGLLVARLTSASGPAFAAARCAIRREVLARVFERPDLVDRK
jgi:urease accessory protein